MAVLRGPPLPPVTSRHGGAGLEVRAVVAHRLSCSMGVWEISDQGSNPASPMSLRH